MEEKIRKIFAEKLPQSDLNASDALADDGLLDSLSLAVLVSELSAEFGVEFDMDDLMPEDFNNVSSIAQAVRRLQA